MRGFFGHWILSSIALAATASLLSGVHIGGLFPLLGAALVLGFLNAILKPGLVLLTLPLTIASLGLFYFVLNGILFYLAAALVPGFDVDSVGSGVWGALVMGLISWFLGSLDRKQEDP